MSVHVCRGRPGAEVGFAARRHEEESVASPGSPQQRAAMTLGMPPAPPTRSLAALSFLSSFFPLFHLCRQQRPQLWQQGQGWGWPEWDLGSSLPAHCPPASPAPGALWLPGPAGRGPGTAFSSCLMVFYPPVLRGSTGKREDIRYARVVKAERGSRSPCPECGWKGPVLPGEENRLRHGVWMAVAVPVIRGAPGRAGGRRWHL